MSTKQQAKLAEKLAKKNAAAAKRKEIQEGLEQEAQIMETHKPKRQRATGTPAQQIPVT
ncbi:DNA-directed RNA polymerase subunit beta [Sesbania bispinosa]|nr:DNA-directed RNA polymerase subunit beta [Sesbania bispinosa]